MTAALYLTVYAASAPNGASLGTVNEYSELSYHHVLAGTGEGRVKIARGKAQAALLVQGRYCRVNSAIGVVGGFWLNEAVVDLSSEQEEGGQFIEFNGMGAMGYLSNAMWDHVTWLANPLDRHGTPATPRDDGRWYWWHDQYGDILKRGIDEAKAAARPSQPIPALTYDFTSSADSAAVAWPTFTGSFSLSSGENLLDSAQQFAQRGFILQMTDSLVLHAYNSYGTDRSSATYASGKVRFAVASNIATAIQRAIAEDAKKRRLLVGGQDYTFLSVTDSGYPGTPQPEAFLSNGDSPDPNVLQRAGDEDLAARKRRADVFSFPLKGHGNTPLSGIYEPGPPSLGGAHFWVGDTATIYSGTGTYDVNNSPQRVMGITWTAVDNGDYDVIVELGGEYAWTGIGVTTTASGAVVGGGGGCTCPMCDCIDPFDRTVASGFGTGPLGPWTGNGDSVSGVEGLMDNGTAELLYALGNGEIELLLDYTVAPTSGNSWQMNFGVSAGAQPAGDNVSFGISGYGASDKVVSVVDDRGRITPGGDDFGYDSTPLPSPAYNVALRTRLLIDAHGVYARAWVAGTVEPVTTAPLTPGVGGRGEKWNAYWVNDPGGMVAETFDRIYLLSAMANGTIRYDRLEVITPCYAGSSPKAARCDHQHPAADVLGLTTSATTAPELLTADNSTFSASLGDWTNSGGTLTRDTTALYRFANLPASAKLVTTAINQYLEVPLIGEDLFVAGHEYDVVVAFVLEQTPAVISYSLDVGVVGTANSATSSASQYGGYPPGAGKYKVLALRWVPTATTSAAVLRLTRLNATVDGTFTWHIGYALVHGVAPGSPLGVFRNPDPSLSGADQLYGAGGVYGWQLHVWGDNDSHLILGQNTAELALDSNAGLAAYPSGSEWQAYVWAKHAPADRVAAVDFEVGDDFVGLAIGEKDSSTVQMFPDYGDYDIEILDGDSSSATKHWHAVTADGVRSRLGAYFQWAFYVAGVLTVGTNKGAYWQVPTNCRIDEVRCHVGTAPTGAAILVDVNDDGTTVFTTQSHRPSIAAAGTDATSGTADGGTAIAKDSVLTVDVDQIGSGTAGSDLAIFVRGRYIW